MPSSYASWASQPGSRIVDYMGKGQRKESKKKRKKGKRKWKNLKGNKNNVTNNPNS